MEYLKSKTPAKLVAVKSKELNEVILNTMKTIASIVGGTLGPGGRPVLIERQEYGIGPSVTKDGVTVFRSLGFKNPIAHIIMEGTRDSAIRTANEAGDGTTTATILSESIVRNLTEFCEENPTVSPQKVVRELEATFKNIIEPTIKKWSTKVTLNTKKDKEVLKSVAKVSANGDIALAEAVMECYDITGDAGNVSITEAVGPSKYEVEKIEGYPIPMGYDDSTLKFQHDFYDPSTGAIVMDNPVFILYHGKITEFNTIDNITTKIGTEWLRDSQGEGAKWKNVIIVATGFSETVIAQLAAGFHRTDSINIFPLLAPLTQQHNGQMLLLQDLEAITDGSIYDNLSNSLEFAELEDLGHADQFQCGRTKSVVLGYADTGLLEARIEEVQKLLEKPESQLDEQLLRERLAKLSGGIAKLRVWGSSNGELKEKKDRAEDAVCAVRGAIKQGVLPGGAWTLLNLSRELEEKNYKTDESRAINLIMAEALLEPFKTLCLNSGLNADEANGIYEKIMEDDDLIYDFQEHKFVAPFKTGILDSTPAVLEAIRSSLSIASLVGTMGGVICQDRDYGFEKEEAYNAADWDRNSHINPADERP